MLFSLDEARPLGAPDKNGRLAPAGSIADPELAAMVSGYKRTVAKRYRSLSPEQLDFLPKGELLVSPKIDGELWFFVSADGETAFVAPNGKVLTGDDIPLVAEVAKNVAGRTRGLFVAAGEMFAVRRGARPRVADVHKILVSGEGAAVERLGFQAFDLVSGGDAENEGPMPDYRERLACLQRVFAGGKRAQCVLTESVSTYDQVQEKFAEWVEGGKGEGLVVRSVEIGRIIKLKPIFTIDAAVIGFTERADEESMVRSLLLALVREDGTFQVIGSCGNMGDDELRRELHEKLAPDAIPSAYRHASSTGALFRLVRPKLVVEVRCTDLIGEDTDGRPTQRMVLRATEDRWEPVAPLPGVAILHPVLERVRHDKTPDGVDCRVAQVLERILVDDVDKAAEARTLPSSEVVRREVWTKETKGKLAVRKLVVWRTNKDQLDGDYPPFVVHWTDYSAGRKEPLQRDVKLAADEATAMAIADDFATQGAKRGWKPAEA